MNKEEFTKCFVLIFIPMIIVAVGSIVMEQIKYYQEKCAKRCSYFEMEMQPLVMHSEYSNNYSYNEDPCYCLNETHGFIVFEKCLEEVGR